MIVHATADEARGQPAPAGRSVTLIDAVPGSAARAERRVALVVGNSNYAAEKISLPNPKNDATDMAAALRKLGFEVLTAIDATKQEFESMVADFARMGTNADMALFFYAGHALQFEGQNYLMPVDGELKDSYSTWSMVRMDNVRKALDRVSGLKVMILDACRNNPLSDRIYRSPGGESSHRGLARIDKTQGMIVAYATAADEVAEDGKGRNSPFTGALLTRIDEAGLEITKMLRLVGADVSFKTEGRQRPEITVQSYNDYFLNQSDRAAWEKIKNSVDPSNLRDFVTRFPSSPYYAVVRDRLEQSTMAHDREEERRRQQAETERQAALQREENDRRIKAAEDLRLRTEREATARREADERERQQAAADAERRTKAAEDLRLQTEREATAKREADERERHQAAAESERRRAEQQRQDDERRAKAAEDLRLRTERDAAAKREAEERKRQQADEAEHRRPGQRRKDDERRTKSAEAEHQRQKSDGKAKQETKPADPPGHGGAKPTMLGQAF